MDIQYILVFTLIGLAVGWFRLRKKAGLLLTLSALSIFWLQPLTPIRNLDFWFPTASIALTVIVWAAAYPGEKRTADQILPGLTILILVILVIGASRYIDPICCLGGSRPPEIKSVLAAAISIAALSILVYFTSRFRIGKFVVPFLSFLLITLFIILKQEEFSRLTGAWLRKLSGQSSSLASSGDLVWLGFSFLAFRLLSVLRDRQAGRLQVYSLLDFATYALFFPAVVSGPIDRLQHFGAELERSAEIQKSTAWKEIVFRNSIMGLGRILIGAFKKIVLADSLAHFALNSQNAIQISSSGWAWFLLMAYSLRIYLDFSGYTDIALGTARLMGISLPENFDRPYLKPNLTAFWNSWHITLTQWLRSYVFYPLTRFLRDPQWSLPTWLVIFFGQFLTMVFIGLWHGITWNFLLWGIWHALGLFVQNRWSDWMRPRLEAIHQNHLTRSLLQGSSWFVTFLYVSLGWVWFVLPNPQMSWAVLLKLVGIGI